MSVRNSLQALALVLVLSAPLGLVGCGGSGDGSASDGSASSDRASVVLISGASLTVGAYERSHKASFDAMCATYDFDCRAVDSIDYAVAEQTLTRLATSGTDLIVVNSSGFAEALTEVAPDFPETWFIMTSDIDSPDGLENVAGFVNDWAEFGYLGGVAGAHISDTGVFGFSNGEPLTVADKVMGGFIDGARSVNPDSKLVVRYANSWTDTTLTREASLAMLNAGADLLSGLAGSASPGTIQAVQREKADYIGYYADEYEEAPCCVRTSMVVNTEQQYDQLGQLYAGEKLQPKLYLSTVENGGITLAPLRGVPKATAQKIQAIQQKIADGEIEVTSKPYAAP